MKQNVKISALKQSLSQVVFQKAPLYKNILQLMQRTGSFGNKPQDRSLLNMQNTPNQGILPSPFLSSILQRNRLNSFNSCCFMTPMHLVQSPVVSDPENFFEFSLKTVEPMESFALNNEEIQQKINTVEEQDDSEEQLSQRVEGPHDLEIRSMLECIIINLGNNQKAIDNKKQELSTHSEKQLLKIFNNLVKKFKKIKKTKEEMIKYCMRKAFKFVIDKVKKTSSLRDGNDCLKYYFRQYEKDKTFIIPFKKNSVNKTMNSQFLKRVFNCPAFVQDYRKFLQKFETEAKRDNIKKINVFIRFLSQCVTLKNAKRIQNYKRFPWTSGIIIKVVEMAHNLFLQNVQQQHTKTSVEEEKTDSNILIKQSKRNIILLTPSIVPMNMPHQSI